MRQRAGADLSHVAAPIVAPEPSADGARRWWMLAFLCVSRIGLGFQFQTMGSVSDPVVVELLLNYTQIGTLIGLFMLPGLFLAIPAGYVSRFASDAWLAGIGLALLGFGGVIAASADGFGLLALGRLACGAGFVLSTIYFAKMVSEWFAGKELATAMSLLVMTWPLGIAMGQVGHEWLATVYDWRAAFAVAGAYCLIASVVVVVCYRPPPVRQAAATISGWRLPRRELVLTLLAALVWAFFNAGYVVYLSFAPKVLTAAGYPSFEAAAVISLGSWVMIVSGAVCGYIADRTGRTDLILYTCMGVAVLVLALLPLTDFAVPLSLAFGLLAMAPAGVIMALTGLAMAPQRRAFAMGVFFSIYFLVSAPAPAMAGWLFDLYANPYLPVLFGAALFGATALANAAFRLAHKRYV